MHDRQRMAKHDKLCDGCLSAFVFRRAALQCLLYARIMNTFCSDDLQVHKIAQLDMRMANTDRNGGNILARHDVDGQWQLVPVRSSAVRTSELWLRLAITSVAAGWRPVLLSVVRPLPRAPRTAAVCAVE